jgi:thymidylate synthase (FAD)
MTPADLFAKIGVDDNNGYPRIASPIHATGAGNLYLKHPGLALMAKLKFEYSGLEDFLAGFPEKLGFSDFLGDTLELPNGRALADSSQAIRTAGPLCYMSFGPKRTKNRDSEKYITHLKEMGHWSVFRHAVFEMVFWGISRSVTHELVRHDFLEPSQTSQRYTTKETLRFVERPEYQDHPFLHAFFLNHVNVLAQSYSDLEELIRQIQKEEQQFTSSSKTQIKKNRQQAARGILSNVVEAPIYITANANAWRHFIDVRASEGADPEIRHLAILVLVILDHVDPLIFGDYKIVKAEDGDYIAISPYKGA